MSWWRANRFWLPLVPVALVAMLAASSYHVKTFWYDDGLRKSVATADAGHYVAVDIPYTDAQGRTAYRFRVRLDGLDRVTTMTDENGDTVPVPEGVTGYRLRLSFVADPSVALAYCQITVVDSAGRQYRVGRTAEYGLCVPQGHEGPSPALSKGLRRGAVETGHQRPTRWVAHPVVLVKDGARPTQVRLYFDLPDYVSLPVPR